MYNLTSKEKRQARVISLQTIYASELNGSDINETFKYIIDEKNKISNDVVKYGKKLSTLIFMHAIETDKLIKLKSTNWDFDRIALIDRLILRMSLVEMIYMKDIPLKVSIAEGVEIAKLFSTDDSSGFINGILDCVYNEILLNKESLN